jgi:hypothetical protein
MSVGIGQYPCASACRWLIDVWGLPDACSAVQALSVSLYSGSNESGNGNEFPIYWVHGVPPKSNHARLVQYRARKQAADQ